MANKATTQPNLAELTEKEFDLRMKLEDLECKRSPENAEERARTAARYAQAKADLVAARKALGLAEKA